VLDAGVLTDGTGRVVDFKNTILIMTSNLGTREALESRDFGFGDADEEGESDYQAMSKKMTDLMKNMFSPEFVNRVDDVIVFRRLTREVAFDILELYLKDVQDRLNEKGVTLNVTQSVRDEIVAKGFSRDSGARALQRTVERMLEDVLAEEMLRGKIGPGATIRAKMSKGKVIFSKIESIEKEEKNVGTIAPDEKVG